jgi:hypothetical protein
MVTAGQMSNFAKAFFALVGYFLRSKSRKSVSVVHVHV